MAASLAASLAAHWPLIGRRLCAAHLSGGNGGHKPTAWRVAPVSATSVAPENVPFQNVAPAMAEKILAIAAPRGMRMMAAPQAWRGDRVGGKIP
jgi:hypothetical protein